MRQAPPAVILAGGLSTRMGGGDKGLRDLGGRPMLSHIIQRLAPQCSGLALNANGDPSRFAPLGLPVLPDSLPPGVPAFPGPLAGVLAALDWAFALGSEAVLTVPSDTPFLPIDLVQRLQATDPKGLCLAAGLAPTGESRLHPTCGLWPVALRPTLAQALAEGERRIGRWGLAQGAALVPIPAAVPDPFLNINTPEDLALAEAWLAAP